MKYASLRQGLVGAWCPSLGPSGYTLFDRSGYGNHGTLTNMDAGTDWVASRYGWALDFDGSNDHIVGRCPNLQPAQGTVSGFVFRKNVTLSGLAYLFVHRGTAGGNSRTYLGVDASWNATALLGDATPSAITGTAITLEAWSHIAIAWNNGTAILYQNGLSAATGTYGNFTTNSTFFTLGAFNNADGVASSGYAPICLDDTRLYSRQLSANEVCILAAEPGIGLKPERTSVFFGAQLFNAAWAKNSNQLISAGVI